MKQPTQLSDTNTGLWEVTTVTSTWLLDLDHRQVKRLPKTAYGTKVPVGPHAAMPVNELTGDGSWLPLRRLIHCRLGARMQLSVPGERGPRVSTPVLCIRPATHPRPTEETVP